MSRVPSVFNQEAKFRVLHEYTDLSLDLKFSNLHEANTPCLIQVLFAVSSSAVSSPRA